MARRKAKPESADNTTTTSQSSATPGITITASTSSSYSTITSTTTTAPGDVVYSENDPPDPDMQRRLPRDLHRLSSDDMDEDTVRYWARYRKYPEGQRFFGEFEGWEVVLCLKYDGISNPPSKGADPLEHALWYKNNKPAIESALRGRTASRAPVSNAGESHRPLKDRFTFSGGQEQASENARGAPRGVARPEAKPVCNRVFISYSHKDKKWLRELLDHLKPYTLQESVTVWSDENISPGQEWFAEIKAALASTGVAVLLVTKDFIASEFIAKYEFGPLLERARTRDVQIIPIPVGACAYEETELKTIQAVINPAKPLAKMKPEDRNEAWVKICKAIKEAVTCKEAKAAIAKS